jgi:uncharacterized protein YbaA (DUF1428 family)
MPKYVDGFVIPVPEKNLKAYTRIATQAAAIWREHGALEYRESVGEDLSPPFAQPFPRGIRARRGETIVFAWILYRSRAHRDKVNARVMKDPRIAALCKPETLPFDADRMLYGGFKVIVEA